MARRKVESTFNQSVFFFPFQKEEVTVRRKTERKKKEKQKLISGEGEELPAADWQRRGEHSEWHVQQRWRQAVVTRGSAAAARVRVVAAAVERRASPPGQLLVGERRLGSVAT